MFIILKIVQFLQITCYIFIGSSIIYYKDSLKIESSQSIKKIAVYCLIGMLILIALDMLVFIVYTIELAKEFNQKVPFIMLSLFFGFIFAGVEVALF